MLETIFNFPTFGSSYDIMHSAYSQKFLAITAKSDFVPFTEQNMCGDFRIRCILKKCAQFSMAHRPLSLAKEKIQLLNFAYKRLLNKPYENEVTLTGQNPPLKCCQHLELAPCAIFDLLV